MDLESRFERLVEEKAGVHDLRDFIRQMVIQIADAHDDEERMRIVDGYEEEDEVCEGCKALSDQVDKIGIMLVEERARASKLESDFEDWQHEICQQQIGEIDRLQELREKENYELEKQILELERQASNHQQKAAKLNDCVTELTETLTYMQVKLDNDRDNMKTRLDMERQMWDEERKLAMGEVVQVTQRRIQLMSDMELLEEENLRLQRRCADDTEKMMELQWENDTLRRAKEIHEEERKRAKLLPITHIRPRKSSLSFQAAGPEGINVAQKVLTNLDADLQKGGHTLQVPGARLRPSIPSPKRSSMPDTPKSAERAKPETLSLTIPGTIEVPQGGQIIVSDCEDMDSDVEEFPDAVPFHDEAPTPDIPTKDIVTPIPAPMPTPEIPPTAEIKTAEIVPVETKKNAEVAVEDIISESPEVVVEVTVQEVKVEEATEKVEEVTEKVEEVTEKVEKVTEKVEEVTEEVKDVAKEEIKDITKEEVKDVVKEGVKNETPDSGNTSVDFEDVDIGNSVSDSTILPTPIKVDTADLEQTSQEEASPEQVMKAVSLSGRSDSGIGLEDIEPSTPQA